MSEVDENVPEIVTDAEKNRKYIEDFIDQIQADNFAKAEKTFSGMVDDRLADALDQQKAKIAGAVFNNAEMDNAVLEPETETEAELEDENEVVLASEDDFEDDFDDEEVEN